MCFMLICAGLFIFYEKNEYKTCFLSHNIYICIARLIYIWLKILGFRAEDLFFLENFEHKKNRLS